MKVADVDDAAPPDFGFPNCLYNAAGKILENDVADGLCDPNHTPPEQLLGLHVSADGLAFGPDDSFWSGDLFIAEFGNFFGTQVVGHRVVRVPIENGVAGEPQIFVADATPLDLAFGPAGLYVADFGTGAIKLYAAPPG